MGQTAGEASTTTNLGVASLSSLAASGGSANRVKLIVLECLRALSSSIHSAEDNALQNGFLAPPLLSASRSGCFSVEFQPPSAMVKGQPNYSGVRLVNETSVEVHLSNRAGCIMPAKKRVSNGSKVQYPHLEVITSHGSNAAG